MKCCVGFRVKREFSKMFFYQSTVVEKMWRSVQNKKQEVIVPFLTCRLASDYLQ